MVMALMMLTATPVVISNDGVQVFADDVRDNLMETFDKNSDAPTSGEEKDPGCLTEDEWKATFSKDEKDWDREDVDRKESNEYREGNEKRVGDEAVNIDVSQKDEDCLTAEQWEARYRYDENREEPCFTLREFERKLFDERKDWERDDKDWDRENWSDEDKKNWSRDDKDWDREIWSGEEREKHDKDEACLTMEEWKERFGRDKENRDKEDRGRDEFRRSIMALAEACADGDEEACEKLESLIRGCDHEGDDRDEEDRDEEDNEEREDSDEGTEE